MERQVPDQPACTDGGLPEPGGREELAATGGSRVCLPFPAVTNGL